eukprot:GSChrysophyteH2.ASY1.ANO1.1716.1 assembled CDS
MFMKAIEERNQKEIEGRRREQEVYENMADPITLAVAQEKEANDPMDFSKLLRSMVFFNGYRLVEDTLNATGDVGADTIPILKSHWAEKMVTTIYNSYTNDSGFMSLEGFVSFMSDTGIVNTHCPHTHFDEPVMDIAENLDPVRLLTTISKPSVQGINNPEENIASAALQEALRSDNFVINFAQFYQIIFKIAYVVYPQVYKKNRSEAFNKVLLESVLPLYTWKLEKHDKLGCVDPLLTDERIALLFMTYAPNLWMVFLMYAGDINHKPPSHKLAFPLYAQAAEYSLFGNSPGCPYTAPDDNSNNGGAANTAKYGLFISEKSCLKFCNDFAIANDLLPRSRLSKLFRALNRQKSLNTGRVTTETTTGSDAAKHALDARAQKNSNLSGLTMSQKLKSKRMSVVGTIDAHYGINADTGPVVKSKESMVHKDGGLSFTEFCEFIARVALEGMDFDHFQQLFPSPFQKVLAILTIWGVADTKKLEDALQLHVDIVI